MIMMETTTVQIRKTLRAKLQRAKIYPKESLDSVIARLLDADVDYEPLSKAEIRGIEKGLADIKAGRVHTLNEVREQLGI